MSSRNNNSPLPPSAVKMAGTSFLCAMLGMPLWLASQAALGQEYDTQEPEHRNVAGVFVGITHEGRRNNDPSVGIAYERRVGQRLGFGAFVEHTFGDADFTVIALPIVFHFDRVRLFAAPGIEDNRAGTESLLRLGVEYEFKFQRYEIVPALSVDFVDGEEVVVAGVGFGLPF